MKEDIKAHDNVLSLIGNTPLIKLNRITESLPGNYYAWSDQTYGIRVGWKPTNANYFNIYDIISLKWYTTGQSEATHPSFNVYSRLSLSEDDATKKAVEFKISDIKNRMSERYSKINEIQQDLVKKEKDHKEKMVKMEKDMRDSVKNLSSQEQK